MVNRVLFKSKLLHHSPIFYKNFFAQGSKVELWSCSHRLHLQDKCLPNDIVYNYRSYLHKYNILRWICIFSNWESLGLSMDIIMYKTIVWGFGYSHCKCKYYRCRPCYFLSYFARVSIVISFAMSIALTQKCCCEL